MTLLELTGVTRHFVTGGRKSRIVRALDGVDLTIGASETVGIVGESGCGKSSLARVALKLLEPSAGAIRFDGTDITTLSPARMRPYRQHIQAVFQDPLASLNARMTIAQVLAEPFETHGLTPEEGVPARIQRLLSDVGLGHIDTSRRPGQFSGGQLQRIAIARALAVEPRLIVADEPTSALDPSIQGQVANLFLDIRRARGTAFLIISHDIDIIGHLSDRIAVMYLGKVVELGAAADLMAAPLHPYTAKLIDCVPVLGQPDRRLDAIEGRPPVVNRLPDGCAFAARCPRAQEDCRTGVIPMTPVGAGRAVRCLHPLTADQEAPA